MGFFTDEQHAKFRLDVEARSRHAAHLKELRRARVERGGAMSSAERKRAFVSRSNDISEINVVAADDARREACRFDFPLFVATYGAALIRDHQPSEMMIERFVRPLGESVLHGGQLLVEAPRGKGKTTFIDLCAAWAIAFGHRRYVVLISATGKLAKVNLKNVMAVFRTEAFAADFPWISEPFRALGGKWQLCESQTYNGESTGIETKADHVTLPTLRDADGKVIGDAAGAILFSGGVGGAIRGLNEGGLRPDLVFFDDIQKRKDAKSPTLSAELEEFVNQDAMGLFGHGAQKTALMAITPICDGDFASLMADKERNPAWVSIIIPLVVEWPANMDLVDRFFALYKEDCARDDFARTQSTAFYRENREALNEGCVLLDPLDGDPGEVDALHHVLLIVATIGREAFDAEYQMRVREAGVALAVTADIVKHALNGVPEFVLPPGTDTVVGFCDVNARAASGLRYVIKAMGAGRVTGVITRGKFPAGRKPLFDEATPDVKKPEIISRAVRQVGAIVAGLPLRFPNGRAARVSAFAFDGGNWTSAVSRAVLHLRTVDRVPFMCFWTLGRAWSKFNDDRKSGHRRGDHMFYAESKNGGHIVFHADYWREVSQSLYLSEPLTPSSCSLYGSDAARHDEFAQEVCAERLVRKFIRPDGRLEWDWKLVSKMNHWGDADTGANVVGSWVRAFETDERLIDRAAAAAKFRRVTPTDGGSDREAMERELAAYQAAHPEVATAKSSAVTTFVPARRPKKRFHFSYRLK